MVVVAAVSSRKARVSGSRSGWASNQACRAALTSSRSCSAACVALFAGDAMAGKEAGQAARAGHDTLRGQPITQFGQEDLWLPLVGGQDQVGMRLDAVRAVIATRRFGRDLPLPAVARRPAAGTRHAHLEMGRRLMAGRAPCHGCNDTFAQINRQ